MPAVQPVPERMRAVEISRPGGPEVLVQVERPVPRPGAGDVLIAVEAAGVNRPDVSQRLGNYPPPPGASDLPGLEVAGRVAALGTGDCAGLAIGAAVCALTPGGGYAEYCVTPAAHCLPVPSGLGPIEAAGMPETCFTVWHNVFERGRLAAGEVLLVHGGTSGIGTTAIQIARGRGARVLVTAGSPEKCAACVELGVERAINYRTEDFVAVAREHTGGRGVDVILDMVGGDYTARNIALLAPDGRLAQIAFLGAPGKTVPTTIDMLQVMIRRLTITGSTLRPRTNEFKAGLARAVREQVWPLVEAGQFRPLIARVLPLAEAAEAHRLLEGGAVVGKIILRVRE